MFVTICAIRRFHSRVFKNPPVISTLSRINVVHNLIHSYSTLISVRFVSVISSLLRPDLKVTSSVQVYLPQCMHFSYVPYMLHISSISLSLVWYPSNYATFAVCCYILFLECKYFPLHSGLKHLQSATTTTTSLPLPLLLQLLLLRRVPHQCADYSGRAVWAVYCHLPLSF
jgi:hypothetical protein